MRKGVCVLAGLGFGLLVGTSAMAAGPAAIGTEKCGKMCHKAEYQSWAKSKHALSTGKKAECETCHGNGADYAKMAIMRDPAKAKSFGLIAKPDLASCARCHKRDELKADALKKAHDKKKSCIHSCH